MAKKRQKMLIWGQAKSQKVTQLFEEASLSSVVDVSSTSTDVNVVVFHRFVVSSFRRRRRPSFDDFFRRLVNMFLENIIFIILPKMSISALTKQHKGPTYSLIWLCKSASVFSSPLNEQSLA